MQRRRAEELEQQAIASGQDPSSAVLSEFPFLQPGTVDVEESVTEEVEEDIPQNPYQLQLPDYSVMNVPAGISRAEASRLAREQFPSAFQMGTPIEPEPEEGTFFSSLYSGLMGSIESIPGGAQALYGGVTGDGDAFEAGKARVKQADERMAERAGRLTTLEDVSKAYDDEGLISATAKWLELATETTGQSIGYMAPSLVGGAVLGRMGTVAGAMLGGPVGAVVGTGVGTVLGRGLGAFNVANRASKAYKAASIGRTVGRTLGYTGTQTTNYLASNLQRSIEAAEKRGEDLTEEDYDVLGQIAIAGGQTALESMMVLLAGGSLVVGNVGKTLSSSGKRTAMRTLAEQIERIDNLTPLHRFVATMAEEEVAEVGQQALERLAAGETVSPADEDAAREYIQIALTAIGPSMFFGGVGSVNAKYQASKENKAAMAVENARTEILEIQKHSAKRAEEEEALKLEGEAKENRQRYIDEVGPSLEAGRTAEDVHQAAESRNIKSRDMGFHSFTRRLVGKARLDDLNPQELEQVYQAISALPVQEAEISLAIASKGDAVLLSDAIAEGGKTTLTDEVILDALEKTNLLGVDKRYVTKPELSDIAASFRNRLDDLGLVKKKKGIIGPVIDLEKAEELRAGLDSSPSGRDISNLVPQSDYDAALRYARLQGNGYFPDLDTFMRISNDPELGGTGIKNTDFYEDVLNEAIARGDIAPDGSRRIVVPRTPKARKKKYVLEQLKSGREPSLLGTFDTPSEADQAKADLVKEAKDIRSTGRGPANIPELSVRELPDITGQNIGRTELAAFGPKGEPELVSEYEYEVKKSKEWVVKDRDGGILSYHKTPAQARQDIKRRRAEGQKNVSSVPSKEDIFSVVEYEAGLESGKKARARDVPVKKNDGILTEAEANAEAQRLRDKASGGAESFGRRVSEDGSLEEGLGLSAQDLAELREDPVAFAEKKFPIPSGVVYGADTRAESLIKEVRKYLGKDRGLDSFKIQLVDTLKGDSEAQYDPIAGVIRIALDAPSLNDPNLSFQETVSEANKLVDHELVHWAFRSGLITRGEYNVLKRAAARTPIKPAVLASINRNRAANNQEPHPPDYTYQQLALDEYKKQGDREGWIDEDFTEEAIAFMAQDFGADKKNISGKPANIFQKMGRAIANVGNAFRGAGFRSSDEVFQTLYGDTFFKRVDRDMMRDAYYKKRRHQDEYRRLIASITQAAYVDQILQPSTVRALERTGAVAPTAEIAARLSEVDQPTDAEEEGEAQGEAGAGRSARSRASARPSDEFIKEFEESTFEPPLDPGHRALSLRDDDGNAGIVVAKVYPVKEEGDKRVRLEWIMSERPASGGTRGSGFGSRMLNLLTELADKWDITIEATASRAPSMSEDVGLKFPDLRDWYLNNGFEIDPEYFAEDAAVDIIRKPRPDYNPLASINIADAGKGRQSLSRSSFKRDPRQDSEKNPVDRDKPTLPPYKAVPQSRDPKKLMSAVTWGYSRFNSAGDFMGKKGVGIPVFIPAGSTDLFGERHIERHNTDISANTPYANTEEFLVGFFDQLKKSPKDLSSGEIQHHYDPWGQKIVFTWQGDGFTSPGVVVMKYTDQPTAYLQGPRYNVITAYANERYAMNSPQGSFATGPRQGQAVTTDAVRDFYDTDGSFGSPSVGRRAASRLAAVSSAGEQQAIDAYMGPGGMRQRGDKQSLLDSLTSAFRTYQDVPFWEEFRYQYIDKYDAIFRNEKAATAKLRKEGKLGLTIPEMASTSAHAMMMLKDRAGAFLEAMLKYGTIDFTTVEGGDWMDGTVIVNDMGLENFAEDALIYAPGEGIVRRRVEKPGVYEGNGGLIKILSSISRMNDSNVEKFFTYGRAVRAYRLDQQGKPVPEQFKGENMNNALQIGYDNPEIAIAFGNLQKWNKSLVDFSVKTGVLNEQQAEIWLQYADYVPFYLDTTGEMEGELREKFRRASNSEDDFKMLNSMLPKRPSKKYRGFNEGNLDDPIESTIKNSMALINEGMKNVASNRFLRNMVVTGDARRLDDTNFADRQVEHSSVSVYENGKTVRYYVKDPFLHDVMVGSFDGQGPLEGITKVFALPAKILREGVTRMPDFLLANTTRDAILSWLTHSTNSNPISATTDSIRRIFKDTMAREEGGKSTQQRLTRAGAVGGLELKDVDLKGIEKRFSRKISSAGSVPEILTKTWDLLGDVGNFSESAARQRVFERTYDRELNRFRKQGKEQGLTGEALTQYADTHAMGQAAFQAMEVLNFSRRGNSPMLRFLTATVPFLNARIQGLDVLYRNAYHGENTLGVDPDEAKRALMHRASLLFGAGVLYSLMHGIDDEDFENVEEYRRNDNWLIPLGPLATEKTKYAAVPIPFEAGILLKVLPEQLVRLALGESSGEGLRAVGHSITSTLAFNPLPQAIRPLIEQTANYNFFTGQPIVPFFMEKMDQAEQYRGSTTALARVTGNLLPEWAGISPLEIDNLMRGYIGSGWNYIDFFTDIVINRPAFGLTDKAEELVTEKPFFKRFLVNNLGRGNAEDYYRMRDEVDRAVTTLNKIEKRDPSRVAEYQKENSEALRARSYIREADKILKVIRTQRDQIRSANISKEEKGERLRRLRRAEIRIFSNMPKAFGGRG